MLALCMADAELGAATIAKLLPEHFSSPILRRCFERLREHLADPLAGLTDADADLRNALSRLGAVDHEPATAENLEFRFLLLERDRIDRALRAVDPEDGERAVELQRRRAEVANAIASRS